MPTCSSCGASRAAVAAAAPCPKCGTAPAPEIELEVPKRAAPPRAQARKVEPVEVALELAVDPRSLYAAPAAAPTAALARVGSPPTPTVVGSESRQVVEVADVSFDAQLLAEYGNAPSHWVLSPLYAWRVLKRRRDLRRVLAGRREEARRAMTELDDALVAFAERVRPAAEKHPDFTHPLEELRGAEDVLRSRDRVLASEQDAQTARLTSVDARLGKLEAELAEAESAERVVSGELASTQAALARGESKLRRAESELRSAHEREADGSHA
ncbi:MAG TPA: hypothetical protein VH044_17695 [Polyangiaceae bacterium]|nr:hypothetical protein [Polyangiaceae bacterium]